MALKRRIPRKQALQNALLPFLADLDELDKLRDENKKLKNEVWFLEQANKQIESLKEHIAVLKEQLKHK